ncbi:hypothetical protein IV203_029495 [Nitzschia inconspicua]|uniref:Methyltransferase domain-containing protein n=1 Tax=Nitzschia inconspicua TaxID=303405 RepID=A0A9K3LRT0_9STRA|nr:hypothetical protein IV203_029495 [Nitzschia inconspicua]
MTTSTATTISTSNEDSDSGHPSLNNRVVSLLHWWQHHQESSKPIRLVDLRPSSEQRKRTLSIPTPDSIVVSLPIEFLKARSFELPARHIEFDIVLRIEDILQSEEVLLGVRPGTRKRPANPWKISNILLDSEEDLWKPAAKLGLIATQQNPTFPFPRLWQPDPMVERILLPLLIQNHKTQHSVEKHQIQHTNQKSGLHILDLASGSGRDVAFLAEELVTAGISDSRVVGIDHRYNEKETIIVRDFWNRRGIKDQTDSLKLDLSNLQNLDKLVKWRDVKALFCVRFWKPELVKSIATTLVLPSGTVFGLSHFCKPYRGAPWDFEHPSEKTILERDELSELFSGAWNILHNEIAMDSDHGRTMIHFVAQKMT